MESVIANKRKAAGKTGNKVTHAAGISDWTRLTAHSGPTIEVIVEKATEGIGAKYLSTLSSLTGLGTGFIESAMDLSSKSIKRYIAADKKLNAAQSEKVLRLIQLFEKGIEIFGDKKSFNEWLLTPAFGLGLKIPMHLTTTIGGIEMITDELVRIEHGDIA